MGCGLGRRRVGGGGLGVPGLGSSVSGPTMLLHALTYSPDTFELAGVKAGIGVLANARSSARYARDHEGLYYSVDATENTWHGARVVDNVLAYSEDPTNPAWQTVKCDVANGISDPEGGSTAFTLTATDANGYLRQSDVIDLGDWLLPSVWVRRRTGTGNVSILKGSGSLVAIPVTDSWQRLTIGGFLASANRHFYLWLSVSGDEVDVWHPQMENPIGRSDTQTPSEYAPTDATATGRRVFANSNGNSVVDQVVTDAAGALLSPIPMLSDVPLTTNSQTYSHDLTQWTNGAGTDTAAYDAPGLTGKANTASTLTDNEAGLSERVSRTISIPNDSNPVVFKMWIKKDVSATKYARLSPYLSLGTTVFDNYSFLPSTGALAQHSGAGSYQVMADGARWVVCLEQANNASGNTNATLYYEPAFYTTPPTADASATGALVIENSEIHPNKTISEVITAPPIPTTTAPITVAADSVSLDSLNRNSAEGAIYFEWEPGYNAADVAGDEELLSPAAAPGLVYYDGANGNVESTDGTAVAEMAVSVVADTEYKVGVYYSTTDLKMRVCVDGVWGTEVAFDGAYALGAALAVFRNTTHTNKMRNLQVWKATGTVAQKAIIDGLMS